MEKKVAIVQSNYIPWKGYFDFINLVSNDENRKIIVDEIKNLGTKYTELKRPITDAIRVLIQSSFMLSGKLPENQEAIFKNAGTNELRKIAYSRGMTTLREDGLRLARAQVTTLEEVMRVSVLDYQ